MEISKIRHILVQVASALSYLEDLQICHRDVKPENILVFDNDVIQLGDFGMAIFYGDKTRRSTLCGTPEYIAPEVARRAHPTKTKIHDYDARYVDRWALGILAHELVTKRTPFFMKKSALRRTDGDKQRPLHEITLHKVAEFSNWRGFVDSYGSEKQLPKELSNLVDSLLQSNPTKRLSAAKALRHPFLGSPPNQSCKRPATSIVKSNSNRPAKRSKKSSTKSCGLLFAEELPMSK
eukprot:CAMPEP_0116869142 /NCGR_PEP_ID=MMETSP0418-20121206/27593_1 /TAXON_ID=1158023 /ORGANISM="Astrosyne radiata, Strain 13vi08-1A" /LENGTH=235 /DNA_ID=CAMNT_0004505201 /DNA_START=889 /DNA_END=1596 /DNA_ORIENTATION=+